MNFSQKLGLLILILISVSYVYFSFFGDNSKDFTLFPTKQKEMEFNPLEKVADKIDSSAKTDKNIEKALKIYFLDSKGYLRPIKRSCNTNQEKNSSLS